MMRRIIPLLICVTLFGIIKSYAVFLPGDNSGEVKLNVQNVVNGKKLKLNGTQYINANGDSFTIRMYKYYISNFKLIKEDGSEYIEQDSYHLVNEAKSASKVITLKNVSEGKYIAVSFMIGVDSLHNVSGAQSGSLDPINAMFWDWNTGYIMAKMEGYTPGEMNGKELAFHIGGFAGKNSVLRTVVLKLPGKLQVSGGKIPVIHLQSDLGEWFKTPQKIDFSKTPVITTEGAEAVAIADNYADMFTISSVEE